MVGGVVCFTPRRTRRWRDDEGIRKSKFWPPCARPRVVRRSQKSVLRWAVASKHSTCGNGSMRGWPSASCASSDSCGKKTLS